MSWFEPVARHLAVRLGVIDQPDLTVQIVPEHPIPEEMQVGVIYVVGGQDFRKWALFRCPQHEDEIIQLSLMTNRRPCWTIKVDILGRPTVYPSVRQLEGSFAHFWVKSGRITWCLDSGYPIAANLRI